jgi:hypothetical protein
VSEDIYKTKKSKYLKPSTKELETLRKDCTLQYIQPKEYEDKNRTDGGKIKKRPPAE